MKEEKYTPNQFIRSAILRGISDEKYAKAYVEDNPKKIYLESDLADLYRQRRPERRHPIIHGLSADGQDMFSPGKVRL